MLKLKNYSLLFTRKNNIESGLNIEVKRTKIESIVRNNKLEIKWIKAWQHDINL